MLEVDQRNVVLLVKVADWDRCLVRVDLFTGSLQGGGRGAKVMTW